MSLITRCPACGTLFRVVPDQLRISEGWVRCGHCDEVFDAMGQMQTPVPPAISPQAPAPSPTPAAPAILMAGDSLADDLDAVQLDVERYLDLAAPPPEPVATPRPTMAPVPQPSLPPLRPSAPVFPPPTAAPTPAPTFALPPTPAPTPVPTAALSPLPALSPTPAPKAWDEHDDVPTLLASRFGEGDTLPVAPDSEPQWPTPAPAPRPLSSLDDDLFTDPGVSMGDGETVSFVRKAQPKTPKTFWQRTSVRLLLVLLLLLLLLGLGVQAMVRERDRLVTLEPRLRPLLTFICQPLGCSLSAPRRIESVVIDASAFNKVRPGVFRLSFTVRSTADTEVATPAVELTLMDVHDQPVMRRVFNPAEVGGAIALAPKGEWNAVLSLNVDAAEVSERISGYRLLAFYP